MMPKGMESIQVLVGVEAVPLSPKTVSCERLKLPFKDDFFFKQGLLRLR